MIDLVDVPPTAHQLADWIELRLLVEGADTISRSDLVRAMAAEPFIDEPPGAFDDFDLDHGSAGAEATVRLDLHDLEKSDSSITEVTITDALLELHMREQSMREFCPYRIADDCAHKRDSDNDLVQKFLVLLAARLHYGLGPQLPAQEPAILFERLVAVALGNLLGEALRFGWPYRDIDLDGNFSEAANNLASRMGEKIGSAHSVSPNTKDHGLDVAAWFSFNDGRPHQPALLCQCGIGQDIEDKGVSLDLWMDVISFSARPIKGLAFPVHLEEWEEHKQYAQARKAGVLFDRLRLSTLVKDEDLPDELKQKINEWCKTAIEEMPQRED